MARKKTVQIRGDRALEYDGDGNLVGVRRLPSLPNGSAGPDLRSLKAIDLVGFNSVAEAQFVELLSAMCEQMPQGVPVRVARAEVAFQLGVSTETAKRYIEKFCYALSAPFQVVDGNILRKDEPS